MHELFESNGLIAESDWINIIESLKPIDELSDPEDKMAAELLRLVERAVLERVKDIDHVGIFFSGGLDSSLIAAICKKHNVKFTCYTVGFQDGNMNVPEDIIYAEKVAKFLKLNDEFKYKIFNLKEAEDIIAKTAKIIKNIPQYPNINPNVNLGVASVEVAAFSISKKEKHFFSGLGSEELFAGYERHKITPTNQECYNGLIKMHSRDLLRDSAVSTALGFRFLTPFLDKELIEYALRIPVKYKINNNANKIILRNAAAEYLEKFRERLKKAAQYGSSFDKAIGKVAKRQGFNSKAEFAKKMC